MKTLIFILLLCFSACMTKPEIINSVPGKMYVQQNGFDIGSFPKLIRGDSIYWITFSYSDYKFQTTETELINCSKIRDNKVTYFEAIDSIRLFVWNRIKGTYDWKFVKAWDQNNDEYYISQEIKCEFNKYDYLISISK